VEIARQREKTQDTTGKRILSGIGTGKGVVPDSPRATKAFALAALAGSSTLEGTVCEARKKSAWSTVIWHRKEVRGRSELILVERVSSDPEE